jgi:TonB family protein
MESHLMFAPLTTPHSRWKSFLMGGGFQVQLVLAVFVLTAMFPKNIQEVKRYVVTNLVAPVEPVIKARRPVDPRVVVKPLPRPLVETPIVAKLIVPRPAREIRVPEAAVKAPEIELTPKTPELPRLGNVPIAKVVATNGFANPATAITTNAKPAAQVQTGGFGDPNGIPATGDGKHGVNISAKGDLGLPRGAGFGDGRAGAAGVRGMGMAGSGVQSSGFDKQYGAPAAKHAVIESEAGSAVEIIEKPKPTYTEEGRKHGVEGEVRLEVQFTADGHVRVLRVLEGLGFGLDEQALQCAEHIRFKPATHGGQPIDSTAVVHIVFELAS